jgi:hypothetical protein
VPTIEDALNYIGIDYTDAMVEANASRALKAARATVLGAVGKDVETYLPDDPRVDEMILIFFEDLYSQRGVSAKVSGATRWLVFDMEWQLKMELRQKREEAGV